MRSPATSRLTANPDSRHVVTAASGYRKFRQRPWRSRTDSLLTVCSRPESRGSRPPTEALKLSLRPEPAQPAGSTTRRGVRGGQGEEPAWDRLPSPSAAGEGQGHTRSRSTSRGRAPQLPERQPPDLLPPARCGSALPRRRRSRTRRLPATSFLKSLVAVASIRHECRQRGTATCLSRPSTVGPVRIV